MRGSRRGQGIGDAVTPQQVELDPDGTTRSGQHEIDAATDVEGNRTRIEIRQRILQAKTDDTLAGSPCGPNRVGLVVAVEHGNTVCGQPIEDLALGLDDLFRTTELADMGG